MVIYNMKSTFALFFLFHILNTDKRSYKASRFCMVCNKFKLGLHLARDWPLMEEVCYLFNHVHHQPALRTFRQRDRRLAPTSGNALILLTAMARPVPAALSDLGVENVRDVADWLAEHRREHSARYVMRLAYQYRVYSTEETTGRHRTSPVQCQTEDRSQELRALI